LFENVAMPNKLTIPSPAGNNQGSEWGMKMTEVEKNEIRKALQLNLGSRRQEAALYLAARPGKPLKIATVAKAIFDDAEATAKTLQIIRYLQWKIDIIKLSKKYGLADEVDADGARLVTFTIAE
jgi:hypothetical protein